MCIEYYIKIILAKLFFVTCWHDMILQNMTVKVWWCIILKLDVRYGSFIFKVPHLNMLIDYIFTPGHQVSVYLGAFLLWLFHIHVIGWEKCANPSLTEWVLYRLKYLTGRHIFSPMVTKCKPGHTTHNAARKHTVHSHVPINTLVEWSIAGLISCWRK